MDVTDTLCSHCLHTLKNNVHFINVGYIKAELCIQLFIVYGNISLLLKLLLDNRAVNYCLLSHIIVLHP